MVERSLGVREIPGSIPGSPIPDLPLRISFIYSRRPSGHSSTADAIQAALGLSYPLTESLPIDLSSQVHPRIGPAIAWLHYCVARGAPSFWNRLYDEPRAVRTVQRLCRPLRAWHRYRLAKHLHAVDAIVCTQALACAAIALEKSDGRLRSPLVAVITDLSPHAYWISNEVDLYLASTHECAQELMRRGVQSERIRVTGIPIHPRFTSSLSPEAARRELGLDPRRTTLLLAGGSKGIGSLRRAAAALIDGLPSVQVVVACGNNERLQRSLDRLYRVSREKSGRLRALPFTPQMSLCLAAADLMIGKPGGVSAAEAMAADVPLVFLDAIAGAEERNASQLVRRGAALQSAGTHALAGEIAALLASPQRLARLRGEASLLARPHSASAAAEEIVALARATSLFRRTPIFG